MKAEIIKTENEEMESILEYLEDENPESDVYSRSIDNYVKLRKLQMEEEKNERDRKNQLISQIGNWVMEGAKFGIGLGVYYCVYKIGLKFEETGSISSHPMRDLVGNINPFKKKL